MFRLAKNTIKDRLGFGAYIAYSGAAVTALDLPDFAASLHPLEEDVDDFGKQMIHVADMHAVWERRQQESVIVIPDGDVMLSFTREIRAPLGAVWDHLTDPAKRARLFHSEPGGTEAGADGKMGEGGAYVCAHGKQRMGIIYLSDKAEVRGHKVSYPYGIVGVWLETLPASTTARV